MSKKDARHTTRNAALSLQSPTVVALPQPSVISALLQQAVVDLQLS